MDMQLTDIEHEHLSQIKRKQQTIRDDVHQLIAGYCNGVFISGEGGIGKSYCIQDELDKRIGKSGYVLINSNLTARAFYNIMRDNPTRIIWIEDAETILTDRKIWGLLRSACWSQDKENRPPKRMITWATAFTTSNDEDEREGPVIFSGGILVVSNADLTDTPEIRAIKTRIRCSKLEVSREEMVAFIKDYCSKGERLGGDEITPAECWQIALFIINRLDKIKSPHPLSLRDLTNGFNDFLFARNHAGVGWQERIESRLLEAPKVYSSRKQQTMEESAVALEIAGVRGLTTAERIQRWKERTGKDQASYYRALKRKK